MTFTWYFIFNRTDFEATGLVSKTYTLLLEGIGQKDILVTEGNYLGMTYEGVFLCVDMSDQNPFSQDGHGIYIDGNDNVWLGIEIEAP